MNIKNEFMHRIPISFSDPITGLIPKHETELSALLSYFQSVQAINWKDVQLQSVSNETDDEYADKYIDKQNLFFCEYPLFSDNKTVDIWGQMSADLLLFSQDTSKIVLIENKIGSKFTSGGTQLDRQAKYLAASKFENKALIVLSSDIFFDKQWYLKEAKQVAKDHPEVNVFTLSWEQIFSAYRR